MIEALIGGERDGAKLAELALGKLRPKVPALTEALTGHFGAHHAVACAGSSVISTSSTSRFRR